MEVTTKTTKLPETGQTGLKEKSYKPTYYKPSYYIEKPLKEGRAKAFLEAFAAILKHTNYRFLLDLYARVSIKCANCSVACQLYQVTKDPRDVPCYRSNLLLKVYKRHFTFKGWLEGKLLGNEGVTDADIDEMAESFYHCTACRRCSIECPIGIDHAIITHLGRYILSEIGLIPKALVVATREQLEGKTGNTSAIPVPALLSTLEFLEDELKENKGVDIKFPVDKEGAEYVFFPAVSDYLLEPDTLMGIAITYHIAGIDWTIGTGYYDGINYGLFYSDWILGRALQKEIEEVKRLKAKKILIGECGHASRSAKAFLPTFSTDNDIPVVNCMELTLDALRRGKIKLNPDVIKECVTYHDPCNIARSEWIIEQPREILKSFIRNYVDMEPKGSKNYCCGGGGGTVSIDEVHDYRMRVAGKIKAEQIRRTGAQIVVAPCANCKKQLREIVEFYNLPVNVVGLHDLILRAIVIDK